MPAISVMIKPASGLCNMRCDYCFYYDEQSKREHASFGMMSETTLKNVIRRTLLHAEGVYSLAFQGGEPTLCGLDFFKKVMEYIKQYNRNHVQIQLALQTNGYGITEEWAVFFAENHFLIGLSCDGTAAIHNTYRHPNDKGNSYTRLEQTAALFDKHHVDYNILTVVHKDTAEHIEEIYHNFYKKGWRYLQFITCLDPLGEPRGMQPWSLLPETYGMFLCKLFDLWYKDYKKGDAPFIRQFENYVGILLGMEPESCEQRGFCQGQLIVEADGSVYPCDFYVLDEYRMGNFNTDRLDVVEVKRNTNNFQGRSRIHAEKCRRCKWFFICRSGCYRSRIEPGINYFCEGFQMFFEHCFDRLEGIAKEAAKRRNR